MIVNQSEVVASMQYWERKHVAEHGPLDGVSLPKACSKLADLLGAMWFGQESSAQLKDESEIANLIRASQSDDADHADQVAVERAR
jgi:hypothetical protein